VSLIISITVVATVSAQEKYSIPAWVKGVAGFWAENKISDDEFGEGLSFLIDQNIIKVPQIESLKQKVNQLEVEIVQLENQLGDSTSPEQYVAPITVTTDRPSYNDGDIIMISGQVSDILSGYKISIQIFEPDVGSIVYVNQFGVGADKKYNHQLTAGGPGWFSAGEYKVVVTYGTLNRVAETTFYFSDTSNTSPKDCGPNQVFQLGQCIDIDEGQKSFTIKTDQPSYDDGEIIRILGSVGSINESSPNMPITILITGPTGDIVGILQAIPDSTGNFSHEIIAGGSMTDAGYYTITAQYGTQKATTTFSFTT